MATDLIAEAKSIAQILSSFVDVLSNEELMRLAHQINNDSHERELAAKDPRSYFRNHGIELPRNATVTISSLVICISNERGQTWCLVIDSKGIRIDKNY